MEERPEKTLLSTFEALRAKGQSVADSERKELITLIDCVRSGDAFLLEKILDRGADINATDEEGMTALHHAAATRARPCIRVLISYEKCDYLIKDNKGRYASDLAVEWGNDYAVERLLENKQIKQAHRLNVPAWTPSD